MEPLLLASSIDLIVSIEVKRVSTIVSVTSTKLLRNASSKSSTSWQNDASSVISTVADPPFKV